MNHPRLHGLIAAAYTPFHDDGQLNTERIPPLVEHLLGDDVTGVYVCGSTGEGMSLSSDERRAVSEAYVSAVAGRVPVIIQVGHNSVVESQALAAHAQDIGADAISATCPSYFPIGSVESLVDCMSQVASAGPDLPFYYYHIPHLTGASLDMVRFLEIGARRMKNLAGMKYSFQHLHEFQACLEHDSGRFEVLWGCDEMLLGALATGAQAAVGTTYNVAAPVYNRVIEAVSRGDLEEARRHQSRAVKFVRTMFQYPFHPAMKELLKMLGLDCGVCRSPLVASLSADDAARLRVELKTIGFFEWIKD